MDRLARNDLPRILEIVAGTTLPSVAVLSVVYYFVSGNPVQGVVNGLLLGIGVALAGIGFGLFDDET